MPCFGATLRRHSKGGAGVKLRLSLPLPLWGVPDFRARHGGQWRMDKLGKGIKGTRSRPPKVQLVSSGAPCSLPGGAVTESTRDSFFYERLPFVQTGAFLKVWAGFSKPVGCGAKPRGLALRPCLRPSNPHAVQFCHWSLVSSGASSTSSMSSGISGASSAPSMSSGISSPSSSRGARARPTTRLPSDTRMAQTPPP